jgi:hypothetical protein
MGAAGERRVPHPRTILTTLTAAATVAAAAIWLTGPPHPAAVLPPDAAPLPEPVRGAFHVHTTRSDGALAPADVAAAAARAGLRFVMLADHGDGTREPEPPAYVHGVLLIDGVEISTAQGHYIGAGLPKTPYPLGGDAEAVIEDVRRLGGVGAAAHPTSPREELAWHAPEAEPDGVEWLNADSEWRDESRLRLSRALLDYVWRPAGALASILDRPIEALALWDNLSARRPTPGLAGHDAHGGLGEEGGGGAGRRLHLPSYEAAFRTFSLNILPSSRLSGDGASDAARLLDALREGRAFTAIDAVAGPARLEFTAAADGDVVPMGGSTPARRARLTVRGAAPSGARTLLLHRGTIVSEADGGVLTFDTTSPGAYRPEIHAPDAPGRPPVPWVVGNAIYVASQPVADPAVTTVIAESLLGREWQVEADEGSQGRILEATGNRTFSYRLSPGDRRSQFVAFAVSLKGPPADATGLLLRGRAQRPMRVSVQLRFDGDGDARWRRSLYLDGEAERTQRIPLEALRPATGAPGLRSAPPRPSLARATSLLLVVDLTNAVPGAEGAFTLSEIAFVR